MALTEDAAQTGHLVELIRRVVGRLDVVMGFGPSAKAEVILAARPSTVVVEWGARRTDREAWRRERDGFVPALRARLEALRRPQGPRVILLLPAVPANSAATWNRQEVRALLRQAAREAGVATLDLAAAGQLTPDNPSQGEFMELTLALADRRQSKRGWRVVRVSSAQMNEGPGSMAIDGKPETHWHTQYSPAQPKPPHELVIDLGQSLNFSGVSLLPRQDGGVNGRIGKVEVYTAETLDGLTGSPTVVGQGKSSPEPLRVLFGRGIQARYLRLVVLSEAQNGPWASLAELDLLPTLPLTGARPRGQ